MCCCGKPVINGEPGYKWQPNDTPMVHPVHAPQLQDGDVLLFDEPGRCGNTDSHSYHYRVVKQQFGGFALLVRHGGGDERISLGYEHNMNPFLDVLQPLADSSARYWLLNFIYRAIHNAERDAGEVEATRWRRAAAEGRLKTRKQRNSNQVKVWIEPTVVSHAEG